MSATILAVELEFLVGGNLEADEVGLESPRGVLDLLDRRLHGGELDEAEERRVEGLIVLVEGVDFVAMFEEAEKFDSDDAEDGEEDEHDDQDIEGMREHCQQSVDGLVSEVNLVKHCVKS